MGCGVYECEWLWGYGGYAFAFIYEERVSVDQWSESGIRPDELTSVKRIACTCSDTNRVCPCSLPWIVLGKEEAGWPRRKY